MSQLSKLTQAEILEKDFRTELRGYSQSEVDEYLDQIIQDYVAFEKEIARLRKENEALHRDLNNALQRVQKTPATLPVQQPTRTESSQFTNYDVIKRVAQLERQVAQIEKTLATPSLKSQQEILDQEEGQHQSSMAFEASQPLTEEEIEKTLQFTFTK
ncbi:MAG: cell division regulator GpsB [Culicoidibacterales bacterium]